MNRDWNGNKSTIFTIIGASNHSDKEREENDYYATDPAAIDKLLSKEKPFPIVWECACGQGHLAQRLKERGFIVLTSDLIDRGYTGTKVLNFLTANPPPALATY